MTRPSISAWVWIARQDSQVRIEATAMMATPMLTPTSSTRRVRRRMAA